MSALTESNVVLQETCINLEHLDKKGSYSEVYSI